MGLTVHFNIETTCKSRGRIVACLQQIRQLALDLAFEHVGEVVEADNPPPFDDESLYDDPNRWMHIQARTSVDIPWSRTKNGGTSRDVTPLWFCGFSAWPGEGCESIEIVLAEYPRTIEVDYKPENDARFVCDNEPEDVWWGGFRRFDWKKFNRWCERQNRKDLDVNHGRLTLSGQPAPALYNPARLCETRILKVPGSAKINCGGFCKTQYSSRHGMHHFVRCHLSVVQLLRRIESIPTMKVTLDDEGHYETAYYSDDWQEAREAGREPTYVWHDATLDVRTLIQQCNEYNELVAGVTGAFDDMLEAAGSELTGESPIKDYGDFERLEANGRDADYMRDFIKALAAIPKLEPHCEVA